MVDMHDAAESPEELPHESGSSGQLVEALGEALRNQQVRTKEYRVDKGDIPILAQGNWNHWKGSVLLALEEAGLDDILNSSEMLHEMDQESKAKSKIVRAAILRRVNKEERALLQQNATLTAKQLWEKLHQSYAMRNAATALQVLGKYRTLIKKPNEDVISYYTRALALVSELHEAGERISEADLVATILNGLPQDFHLVRTAINTSGEMPTLDRLRSILVNEEYNLSVYKQRKQNQQEETVPSQTPPGVITLPCHANIGHLKHNPKKKKKFSGTCYNCGKRGHMARDCHAPKQNGMGKEDAQVLCAVHSQKHISREWILDSGASDHMTGEKDWYLPGTYVSASGCITLADGRKTCVKGKGTIVVTSGQHQITLTNVLHVPGLHFNLLSASRLVQDTGLNLIMKQDGTCVLKQENQIIELRSQEGGIYSLVSKAEIWHARLGHASVHTLRQLGLPSEMKVCEACVKSKLCRRPHKSVERDMKPLDRISIDIMGPVSPETLSGQRYALVAVDGATKMSMVTLLPSKEHAPGAIKQSVSWFEKMGGASVKSVRVDLAKELTQASMEAWFQSKGIVLETTAGYEPEQNGQVERMNRTLMEGTRAFLEDSNLPPNLWGEALRAFNFVRNMRPANLKGESNKSPLELLTGDTPNLLMLRRWGCRALVHLPKERRSGKLGSRAVEGIFVGYQNSQTYRFIVDKRLVLSRTAVFFEDQDATWVRAGDDDDVIPELLVEPYPSVEESVERPIPTEGLNPGVNQELSPTKTTVTERVLSEEVESQPMEILAEDNMQRTDQALVEEKANNTIAPIEEEIESHLPEDQNMLGPPTHLDLTDEARYNLRPRKPIDYNRMVGRSLRTQVSALEDEFSGYTEAMKRNDWPLWKLAIEDEIRSLVENKTWVATNLPNGRRPLQTKWVFKIKRDAEGNIERHKARLVVKGFQQREGIDYTDIFSPVVSKPAIRMFLTIAASEDMDIQQMDIKTAFLNAELDEEIYMSVPEGIAESPGKVYRLRKSLYGLKQAPREWNRALTSFLSDDLDCKSISVDETVLVCKKQSATCYLCIYVDDILLASKDRQLLDELMKKISDKFKIGYCGEISNFCGMLVQRDRNKRILHLSEPMKIENLLETYNMKDARDKSTPLQVQLESICDSCDVEVVTEYQRLVGQLLYLSTTVRPDLGHAAAVLSRFMSKPGREHWNAAKNVLRYLKGTKYYGIELGDRRNDDSLSMSLEGYCDSDYGTDCETRKSRTGYLFLLNGSLIDWRSQLQPTVATSTAEAEYMSLAECVKKALWYRTFVSEFLDSEAQTVTVYCDNQPCLQMTKDLNSVARTKHIDIRHHFVRERAMRGEIKYEYCSTDMMLADYLTKILRPERFKELMKKLGVKDTVGKHDTKVGPEC